jgi:hypothetical protein
MPTTTICFTIPVFVLVMLLSALPFPVFYLSRALLQTRHSMDNLTTSVPATITRISVGTSRWNDGWVVTARWTNSFNGREYVFKSRPQDLLPKCQVGDQISVEVDPLNPAHYSMNLH